MLFAQKKYSRIGKKYILSIKSKKHFKNWRKQTLIGYVYILLAIVYYTYFVIKRQTDRVWSTYFFNIKPPSLQVFHVLEVLMRQ